MKVCQLVAVLVKEYKYVKETPYEFTYNVNVYILAYSVC